MNLQLSGRRVLITGGGKGAGRLNHGHGVRD
jgi:hypothetical protein